MKPNSDDRDGTQQAAGWVTDAHSPLPPGLPRPEQTNEQLPNLEPSFSASAGLAPAGANK
jgi:hypothetical protein